MIIKEGERIDELQRNGYRIIQKTNGFCFGMDAVLLSGFASVKPGEKALDLGTGTGIIPILLEAKTEGSHFTGLEIQAEMAEMASRSVALNRLEEKVSIVQGDIKEVPTLFEKASFDVVTTNPPYMNDSHGLKNPDLPKAIAAMRFSAIWRMSCARQLRHFVPADDSIWCTVRDGSLRF